MIRVVEDGVGQHQQRPAYWPAGQHILVGWWIGQGISALYLRLRLPSNTTVHCHPANTMINLRISTDPAEFDIAMIHQFLAEESFR